MDMNRSKPTGRRFIFEEQPLSIVDALLEKSRQIAHHCAEIERIAAEPLPKTKLVQTEVQPDDPRYKDAPIAEVWVHYEPRPIKCHQIKRKKS